MGSDCWQAVVGCNGDKFGKTQTQIVAVGTLAPAPLTGPGAWWPDFIKQGSGDGRHISLLQADPEKWRDFDETLRCNPVAAINPYLRKTLEREYGAAIDSDRAARPFKQFRLNIPVIRSIRNRSSLLQNGRVSLLARSRRVKEGR